MCGIGGILRVQQQDGPILSPLDAIPEAWLDIIDDSIKHRGPDGCGRFRDRAMRPDGSIVDDFLFVDAPNALHVVNAPSPAATASLEIASAIVDRVLMSS